MHMVPDPRTDLATTFLWGRARSLTDNSKENSYLAEALLRFASTNYVWTRLENAGRSNELLLTPGSPLPPNFIETPIGHVAAYTLGYDHDLPFGRHLLIAPGAQLTLYRTPAALRPTYGTPPPPKPSSSASASASPSPAPPSPAHSPASHPPAPH